MSFSETQQKLSNADDYFSDDSWSSDFEDSSEASDFKNSTVYNDYSQEIKDNQINEDLEAQLASVYVNTQPANVVTEVSTRSSDVVNETSHDKISTKNLGAIPKSAFTYLSNEIDVDSISDKLTSQRNARNIHNSDLNLATSYKFSQSLNQSDECRDGKVLPCSIPVNKAIVPNLKQNSPNSSKPIVAPKPGKLKPEAFLFLSKVRDKQPTIKSIITNCKEDKHLIPTASADNSGFKPSNTSLAYSQKNITSGKIELVSPESTFPHFVNLQKNPSYMNDTMHNPMVNSPSFENSQKKFSYIANFIPNPVTKTTKDAMTVIGSSRDNFKPPLPLRPPPVFKYPPEMFPQKLSTISKEANYDQTTLSLSPQASSVHTIKNREAFPNRIEKDGRLENVQMDDKKTSQKVIKRDMGAASPIQNIQKFKEIIPEKGFDVLENALINNVDKISGKGSYIEPLSNQINPNMSTRPLPPVPDQPFSKAPTSTHAHLIPLNESDCEVPLDNKMFDPALQEAAPNTQKVNPELLDLKPLPPRRPKRIEDIIANQTNVSNETFESQHKVSAAIAARLQNISLRKTADDSYLDPIKENNKLVFTDESNPTRSLGMHKDPSHFNIPVQPGNSMNVKEHSHPRTLSDIDVLQNAMTRPCLPQKLRSTQRSMSCTSLVQTIKDMSFSIWSNNDKDKRNSEGTSSFEKTNRSLSIENKLNEKFQVQGISSISNNANSSQKVTTARVQKFEFEPSSEKISHIGMSRFPWFHDVDFKEAQTRLLALDEDGTFLIRPSSRPTLETQYTTCVVYRRKVLNLRIRRHSNGRYALGITKDGEKTFASLSDMIKYYQDVPIEFHPDSGSASNQEPIYVCLRITPPKE